MRLPTTLTIVSITALLLASPALAGVWGATDQVPAATLIMPFFEVGVDPAINPHDTLPVVYNRSGSEQVIHWEIWNIDGEGSNFLFGNVTIPPVGTWSGSIRDIINLQANGADRARLRQGDFYRGFMTIDLVPAGTFLSPFEDSYSFLHGNAIVGYAYYVRLLEGSANGLAMIPLEHTTESATGDLAFLNGFYGDNDFREEIDVNARQCAATLTQGGMPGDCDGTDGDFDRIRARIFGSPALNASSRVIVFTWTTDRPSEGGPSAICEANPGLGCPRLYNFRPLQRRRLHRQFRHAATGPRGQHHHPDRASDQRPIRDRQRSGSGNLHADLRLLLQLGVTARKSGSQLGRHPRGNRPALTVDTDVGCRPGALRCVGLFSLNTRSSLVPARLVHAAASTGPKTCTGVLDRVPTFTKQGRKRGESMNRPTAWIPIISLLVLCTSPAVAGVWGATDPVPAATLIVPFVEVGIEIDYNPHDTLPVVFNRSDAPVIVHWEIWGPNGNSSSMLFGNETIEPSATWSGSVRDIIVRQAGSADRGLFARWRLLPRLHDHRRRHLGDHADAARC